MVSSRRHHATVVRINDDRFLKIDDVVVVLPVVMFDRRPCMTSIHGHGRREKVKSRLVDMGSRNFSYSPVPPVCFHGGIINLS